ncbi:hypothetical protein ENBRE01_3068 [Enteropsectra breve]|nr:hypothetical protein ENBRE01_3068 [Enteropsectra breve]
MEWPAYSPDLNPIENLWGLLVQRAYANGTQFANNDEMKLMLTQEWREIGQEHLMNLSMSMKDRIVRVLTKNGSNTKY